MKSVLDMLKIAAMPLGKTMYIYGGGWNERDDGAGRECLSYGLSERWSSFASTCNSGFNFREYDYKRDKEVIHLGLDCSGYVGWVLYNTLGNGDYVFKSCDVVKKLAEMGLGERVERNNVSLRQAGDIFSSACDCCKHVFICIGQCSDGSMLLIHSSPPGVRLAGTPSPIVKGMSRAEMLAEKYMKKFYPRWYVKYPVIGADISYLTHYEQLKNSFLNDSEGIRNMECEDILQRIFF